MAHATLGGLCNGLLLESLFSEPMACSSAIVSPSPFHYVDGLMIINKQEKHAA